MSRNKRRSSELRRLNAALKPLGERICATCRRRLPADEKHFYRAKDTRGGKLVYRWRSDCKECLRAKTAERERQKYRDSKRFREKKRAYRVEYYSKQENREKHRALCRDYMRRRRRAQLEAILQKAKPSQHR